MKKTRFSEQQIAFILRQAEEGKTVEEVCRKAGISVATYYNWRTKYGGLMPSEMKRLKQLEEENRKLKQLVADLSLDKTILQEALRKMQLVPGVEWHLIGTLQSNKSRVAAERFDWVQTVDRVKLANRLSEQRPAQLPPLNVLIEVNISGEASKSGVAVKEVTELAAAIARLPRLRLRGLMAIPAPGAAGDFAKMRRLYEELAARFSFDTLSMGMSDDMDEAIAAGATMVRIGTAIFGARRREESPA